MAARSVVPKCATVRGCVLKEPSSVANNCRAVHAPLPGRGFAGLPTGGCARYRGLPGYIHAALRAAVAGSLKSGKVRRLASRLPLQTKHLRTYRVVNPVPDDRHNRPGRSVPFIDQSVRLAGGAGFVEAA